MATKIYDKARDAFANKLIDLINDDIRCCLVTSSYTPNFATDQYLSTPASNIIANSRMASGMSSKSTNSAGIFSADNVTLGSSNITGTAAAILIYVYNASDSSARLLFYIDNPSQLPATFASATVNVTWDTGSNKIFKL